MIFFKMFKQLSEKFHVYLIDILGMGRSSRSDFNCKTYEECKNYFINSIEKWRAKVGIEKMNLLGHSFGGFLASKYALKYHERINKLILFSPWASEATGEDQIQNFEEDMKKLSFGKRMKYKALKKIYKNSSAFGMGRKAGRWLGGFLVKKFLKKRFGESLEGEDLNAIAVYLEQIVMRKGSSEF